MLHTRLWLSTALVAITHAQSTSSQGDTRVFTTLTGFTESSSTYSYSLPSGQRTNTLTSGFVNLEPTSSSSSSGSVNTLTGTVSTSSASTSSTTSPGSTETITLLLGGGVGIQTISIINGTTTIFPNTTSTPSSTTSSTSTSVRPTNTQPCNGYPEFCGRKYSNITEVATHNAPYAIRRNAASNQDFGVTQQLNDGVRVLTSGVHYVNNTFYNCHTSCDLLNAGTYLSMLSEVASWVRTHPYDVVTILISNDDQRPVEEFVPVIQNSGLSPYVYTPPLVPLRKQDWPTLSQMILTQKRVVFFMDFKANQSSVPYVLDQYSHVWQTPFSPQDINFPCTIAPPPDINETEASRDYMYLANHNLNQAISFAGSNFLIPNTAQINNTNAAGNETGMMGRMADQCRRDWGTPPNWLVVDYYNRGSPYEGSVFEVAANMNNVTYDKSRCCGTVQSGAEGASDLFSKAMLTTAVALAMAWLMA